MISVLALIRIRFFENFHCVDDISEWDALT
jgi:hypothetical protein